MPNDRCPTCDRPVATKADADAYVHTPSHSVPTYMCFAKHWTMDPNCLSHAVDWRARAEAEAERDRYAEREAHFAQVLSVADAGRYRADCDGAIRRLLTERDAAYARGIEDAAKVMDALAEEERCHIDTAARFENGEAVIEHGLRLETAKDAATRIRALATKRSNDDGK